MEELKGIDPNTVFIFSWFGGEVVYTNPPLPQAAY
jgi:hypothetical protein